MTEPLQTYRFGPFHLDIAERRLSRDGTALPLRLKVFDTLRVLVENAGRLVTKEELLQAVWGPDYGDQVDYLRVFVNQLRKKIEAQPSQPVYLVTEPWVGYRFADVDGGVA